uniref:Putative secreted protein n=1 Tax=Anopheles triannulatus TaxID=58253 RepID=A0A2M4B718_9DIPT
MSIARHWQWISFVISLLNSAQERAEKPPPCSRTSSGAPISAVALDRYTRNFPWPVSTSLFSAKNASHISGL